MAQIETDLGPGVFWRVPQWYPELSPTSLDMLRRYFSTLIKFNKTINLVSAKTIPFADVIHFSDSIEASKLIFKKHKPKELWDFGSGNGFPGLVFGILNPDVRLVLLDSDNRKSEFLKSVVSELGLKNVIVENGTIESLKEGSVPYCVSRGLAPIPKAILQGRKAVAKGGVYFMMKGEEWGKELADIPSQLCSFWAPQLLGEYKLPVGEVKFAVVSLTRSGA
jgi:16S rRNA (guanine527-N7)-methyltransferase